jgi:hypothetical protein
MSFITLRPTSCVTSKATDEETGAYIQSYLFREAWLRLNKKPKTQP